MVILGLLPWTDWRQSREHIDRIKLGGVPQVLVWGGESFSRIRLMFLPRGLFKIYTNIIKIVLPELHPNCIKFNSFIYYSLNS